MSPQESIELLDRAVAQLTATREVHVNLQTALNILQGVVFQQESESKGKLEAKKDKKSE